MEPVHKTLFGLLVVQLGLAAVTWSGRGAVAPADAKALVPLEVGDVSELVISGKPTGDAEAKELKLVKDGGGWKVASGGDFPAKKDKVEEILKKVLGIKVRKPIASNKANHNALRVGTRDYDKKVTVVGTSGRYPVVIGSAKGSSVHVRLDNKDEVYWARDISSWAISDSVATYVDTDYFKVADPVEATVKNSHGEFTVAKGADGEWSLRPVPVGQDQKHSEISAFVDKLKTVRLADPVGKEVKPEYGLEGGVRVVLQAPEVQPEAEEGDEAAAAPAAPPKMVEYGFTIGKEQDGKFYVKADDKDYVVLVSKWNLEKVVDQKLADFLKSEEDEAAPPAGGPPGGMPPGLEALMGGGGNASPFGGS